HHAADGQQRLDDGGKPGQTFDQLADALLESSLSDDADLQAEVAQGAAQIGIDVEHLALHQLARRQQHALLLAGQRLHMHGLNRPTRIIWAMPRASCRSDLLICCAFSSDFMWRVSTQITGRPASAMPLTSHCDSGPASIPTRP